MVTSYSYGRFNYGIESIPFDLLSHKQRSKKVAAEHFAINIFTQKNASARFFNRNAVKVYLFLNITHSYQKIF